MYHHSGIVELATVLHDAGWRGLSSGGIACRLVDAGLTVSDGAEVTRRPAILARRVVTLRPKVHGGILADRDNPAHQADLNQYDIELLLLCVHEK